MTTLNPGRGLRPPVHPGMISFSLEVNQGRFTLSHEGLAFQPVFICPRREISQFQKEKSREKRNGCHAEAVAQHSVGGRTVCRKIRRKFESGFSGSDLDRKSEKLRDFCRCEVSELQLPEIRQQHVPVILLFLRILVRVGSG